MDEQKVTIDLRNDDGKDVGILTLIAIKWNLDKIEAFEEDNCFFENVPIVDKPNNETPIQYFSKQSSTNLSKLMLLEETEYQLMFETEDPLINEPELLPTINGQKNFTYPVFKPLRFKIEDKTGYRQAGILNFRSYVGKSFFDVKVNGKICKPIPFEVRSKKINYYEQYPQMIGDLSEIASGLVYENNSPLYQHLEFDLPERKTLYEDFMFLEYLFRPENLPSSYDYIAKNLYSQLVSYLNDVPTTFLSNIGPSDMIDIISRPEHLYKINDPPVDWPETMNGYVPDVVRQRFYHEDIDTPENRFLKYFIESLDKVINNLLDSIDEKNGYIIDQLLGYHKIVQNYLSDSWTGKVGLLEYLPLNSQILQKKEGYRDIFKYYINFELAFRLEWQELEDQIRGYERKLSELYEYWCYFKLIKVLDKISGTKINFADIYELNKNNWSIKIKRGTNSVQKFKMFVNDREIYVELMYNRLFSKRTIHKSYSLPFRPDYTLLIKIGLNHYFIHFDAKYRSEAEILSFYDKLETNETTEAEEEKLEENIGKRDYEEETFKKFKYGDLYKMHTYKDAILKTEGSYVLYPGDDCKIFKVLDEEPIPSVGAFPLTPGKNGIEEEQLSLFMIKVLKDLLKQNIK